MNLSCSRYSLFLRKLFDADVVEGIAEPERGEDLDGLGELDEERKRRVGESKELRFSMVFKFWISPLNYLHVFVV